MHNDVSCTQVQPLHLCSCDKHVQNWLGLAGLDYIAPAITHTSGTVPDISTMNASVLL